MKGILSDHDMEGQFDRILALLSGDPWREFWDALSIRAYKFADLGLAPSAAESAVWDLCQRQDLVLVTNNRNAAGPDSLEETVKLHGRPDSLFTVSEAQRILSRGVYAHRVVERMLGYLLDIDRVRGTGRLYLP